MFHVLLLYIMTFNLVDLWPCIQVIRIIGWSLVSFDEDGIIRAFGLYIYIYIYISHKRKVISGKGSVLKPVQYLGAKLELASKKNSRRGDVQTLS